MRRRKPVDVGFGDSLGRQDPWRGAARSVASATGLRKASATKERGPRRIGALPGLVCSNRSTPTYAKMPSSMLPTLLGDVVVTAADHSR